MRTFRKAIAADASAIANLYRELVSNAPIMVLPERIEEIAHDKNTYLIVCDDDNEIVATALLTLANDVMFTRQPFALLENVIVSKHVQRKGVGKGLMDHIEKFCLAAVITTALTIFTQPWVTTRIPNQVLLKSEDILIFRRKHYATHQFRNSFTFSIFNIARIAQLQPQWLFLFSLGVRKPPFHHTLYCYCWFSADDWLGNLY